VDSSYLFVRNHSVETPHRPTVWSFIQDHLSLIFTFTRTSATSGRDVVCREVEQLLLREGNAVTMDPARSLTTFHLVIVTCLIADNARKTDATLMFGGLVVASASAIYFRGNVMQDNSPALITHTCTMWLICSVHLGRISDPGWSFIL